MTHYRAELAVADRHLTAAELQEKYDTEHPVWRRDAYRAWLDKQNISRNCQYWSWVEHQLEEE